jgi:hypothetical protein
MTESCEGRLCGAEAKLQKAMEANGTILKLAYVCRDLNCRNAIDKFVFRNKDNGLHTAPRRARGHMDVADAHACECVLDGTVGAARKARVAAAKK